MDIPSTILFITSGVTLFLSIIIVSYKTGDVSFSMLSMTRRNQPKFQVDLKRINRFLGITISAFVLNVVYGFVVVRDMREASGILLVGLINTVFIAYAAVYLVLLKER